MPRGLAALALLLLAAPAAADSRPASSGFFAEGGLGATAFLGDMRSYSRAPNVGSTQ